MPDPTFSETLRTTLAKDGYNPDILQEQCLNSERFGPLPLPAHLGKIVEDLHTFTWYSIRGSPQPSRTFRGTRPGSPYADLGFNSFIGQIMLELQEHILQDRELEEAMTQAGLPPTIVGWVDDIAIPICACSPQKLLGMIQRTCEKVIEVMWRAGLTVNLDKGKTECIVNLRGTGAPQTRHDLFVQQEGRIHIEVPEGFCAQSTTLQVVGQYSHLGTCIGQELCMRGEVDRRIGQAQTAFRMLQKPIFKNRRISVRTRFQLLESLVCTKLFYNVGVWGQLTPSLGRRLEHVMISWFRQIVGDGFWCDETTTDEMFLRLWSIPSLQVRIAIAQLRFCIAAFHHGRGTVWEFMKLEAVAGEKSWVGRLKSAIQWMNVILPGRTPEDIDVHHLTVEQLEMWFCGPLRPTKSTLKLLLRKHLLQERSIAEVREGYMKAFAIFEMKGLTNPGHHGTAQGGAYRCDQCPATFARAQQLQAHRWSKHQGVSLERRYVFGPTCLACGVKYWTPQRMQQHLRHSRRIAGGCLEKLFLYVDPAPEVINFEVPHGLQHVRRLPAHAAAEPLTFNGPTRAERKYQAALQQWQEEWAALGLGDSIEEDIWHYAAGQLTRCTERWAADHGERDLVDDWTTAMREWEQLRATPHEVSQWIFIRWYRERMRDTVDTWDDPELVVQAENDGYDLFTALPLHWVLNRKPVWNAKAHDLPPPSTCGIAAPRHSYSNEIYSAYTDQNGFLADLLNPILHQAKERPPVPYIIGPQGERILLILHLFSGRRRKWDFHHWVTELGPTLLEGWQVWTLSFDTAVDERDGNLLGQNYDRLYRLAAEGIFTGSMGGPPCETFSPARHIEQPAEAKGKWPRPLRSSTRLWGLPNLSMREIEQMRVGSKLYIHNTLIDLQVVQHGGFALLEHPADPQEDPKPSTWQSQLHKVYAYALPGTIPIRIDQWKFGASSVKPTVIRSMGGDSQTKFDLLRHQDHQLPRPSTVLKGVDERGQFRTAEAKEYPTLLSKALATTLLQEIARGVKSRPLHGIPSVLLGTDFDWLAQIARNSSCIKANAVWLPDYQR